MQVPPLDVLAKAHAIAELFTRTAFSVIAGMQPIVHRGTPKAAFTCCCHALQAAELAAEYVLTCMAALGQIRTA